MRMYRFKFGLRTLLVAMVPLAAVMAMITQATRTQKQVVEMVIAKGGEVYYRHQRIKPLRYNFNPPAAPAWLRRLLGDDYFQTPERVLLDGNKFTDTDLRALGSLNAVDWIYVDPENRVTSDGLEALQRMVPKCYIEAPFHYFRRSEKVE